MTFLGSHDLAEASVEDVCEEGESINCFFRLKDGREVFVDTNWENINAPMFRDFRRPEFQGTTRWNVLQPSSLDCQDGDCESASEMSQGYMPSNAALPTSPAVHSCDSFEGVNDSSAEVVSAFNGHHFAPSNVPILAQQNPKTPKETKTFRARCVNQSCIPLNMQARPSMPAIDHSLPEQVAQEWSEASLSAITPGLQELPSDTTYTSPQASTQLTFCASQLAKTQTGLASASTTSQSHPAPRKTHPKPQSHHSQPKINTPSTKPARLRGPSPLGGVPMQPNRSQTDALDGPAHDIFLESHAISVSQSASNASTVQAPSVDAHESPADMMATISGGVIPMTVKADADKHPSSTPSSASRPRRAFGKAPSGGSPQRSRSATVKSTPSSHSNPKPTHPAQNTHASSAVAAAGGQQAMQTRGPTWQASAEKADRACHGPKVPAIDLHDPVMDSAPDGRNDTPSPSGLSVKQKIKWHETAVAPEGDAPARTSSGPNRLKRSQSARPAVQVPKYVRCAATAAPRCRPDPPSSSAVTSYPIASPLSRTRSQPAPQRHKFKASLATAPASEKPMPDKGPADKPYVVITPRNRPPPPVQTAPSPSRAGSAQAARANPQLQSSSLRQMRTAPSSTGDAGAAPGFGRHDEHTRDAMPAIAEVEDVIVPPVAIAPLPMLGSSGGRLVASRAAQFERVAVEGSGAEAEAGAKAAMGRVAKLTSSAGRSVGNVFRKLTRTSAQAEGWARSWRFGGSSRGGTPTAGDSPAAGASSDAQSPLSSALGADGGGHTPKLARASSAASIASQQSGPEAVSARHSSVDGHESEAESVTSARATPTLAHMSLDGPITLQSLQSKPAEAAQRPRSARTAWAAAAEARAVAQEEYDVAAKKMLASVDRGPRTVAVVEQGLQREAKGPRSARSVQSQGTQGPSSEHTLRSARGGLTSGPPSAATRGAVSGEKQGRVLRARSGPPESPALCAAENARRRPRVSAESSRPRISAEGSVDTVASNGKQSTGSAVNRLAQRKQTAPALSSEQRELQEIERRRQAAAAERARSRDYWQRTKRAGATPATPPRSFLQKPGAASNAAVRKSADISARTTASAECADVRARSASGTRQPREPREISAITAIQTPVVVALSPFGTTTPPMQAGGCSHPATGGSATFAGFLVAKGAASGDAGLGSGQHRSTPPQWCLPEPSGVLPTPPSASKTPALWGRHHVAASTSQHKVPGDVEVHLESTQAQGIRLSSGLATGGSDSDEVSASLTPRVPASFLQSRAPAAAVKRGALFPLGESMQAAHASTRTAAAGAPKRGSDVRSAEGRNGSLESAALSLHTPSQGGSPRRTHQLSPAHQAHAGGAQVRLAPTGARSLPQKPRPVADQAEAKPAAAVPRRAQSTRSQHGARSVTPPSSVRSARSGTAAASATHARAAPAPASGSSSVRSQHRSPAPRPPASRYGSVQPAKAASTSATMRRQPATVHGAPPPPVGALASAAGRYSGARPHSVAATRPTGTENAYAGIRKAPMSRSCEPGAWRAYQTSNTVPAALRKNPAEERKRTRDRVGKPAIEPNRPLRNLQPWANRAMEGAAAAVLSQGTRGQQDRQVHAVGPSQQGTLMRTHVPIARPAPTKPVSPALATARRSHHSQQRQPASVGAAAGGEGGAGVRPRSVGAALRGSTQGSQSGAGRSLQQTAAAAFNAGVPRVARQFAARRGDKAAPRSRAASASAATKQPASVRTAGAGPRSAAAVGGGVSLAGSGRADSSAAQPVCGRGQLNAIGHKSRSISRSVAAPTTSAAPAIQKPLTTPRAAEEPPSALSPAVETTAACAGMSCGAAAPAEPVPCPEPLSVTSSQAICSVLSDGSLGPVTGSIQGPADMLQGKAPPSMGPASVRSDALLGPDPCVAEVAPEALETIASMAAPAEQVAAAGEGTAVPERCEAAESFMQRTSFILNTELIAAHAGGGPATPAGTPGGSVGRDVSESGRIVVQDRAGVVSCHDSGSAALNRAAAAAAGVMWTGSPAVTVFGRDRCAAGSPEQESGEPAVQGFGGPPAVVALGGAVTRQERSARLSAALPSRLSIGPVATGATAAGTERLQSVLARRRQSKMLRRQSSSSAVSASIDLLQRTKSRRMSVEPLGLLQPSGGLNAISSRPLSPSKSLGLEATALLGREVPEDLQEAKADMENMPQVV